MAKDDKKKPTRSSLNRLISNLVDIGKSTQYATYNVDNDLFNTERMVNKMEDIQNKNKDSVERTVKGTSYANSRINGFGLLGNNTGKGSSYQQLKGKNDENESVFDVIKNNANIFNELKQLLLVDNKLYDTIADYEVLRRSIPEITRVIELLVNSVIIPEVITSETFKLTFNFEDVAKTEIANKLRDKYEIDKKIRTIVENYFVIGTEYVTVVPYKAVIEAIKRDGIGDDVRSKTLRETSLSEVSIPNNSVITESTLVDAMTENMKKEFNKTYSSPRATSVNSELNGFNSEIEQYIGNINVYKSNRKLIYDAALVESVRSDADEFMFESSFEEFLSDSKNIKLKKNSGTRASEGLIEAKKSEYDKISINGCKIERLDPARVYPLRIKDTVIAYIYLEQRRDDALRFNLQNSMRNNFSFYRMHTQTYNEYQVKSLEDRMIRQIGTRVLGSLSPKFVESNFDDMDVFYEFLRDNSIHQEMRDIIILHPDDVIEFKRQNGSILKNAVFFAKLYLLMVINNILVKVRRGSDRTIYYVNNGLSNDVEGSVMAAIEAIQQSEIRFSDLGSIAGIIGSVGSVVDLFIPQQEGGERPVSPEVISGQEVNMDEEFLRYLIKSIILSFNMPSVVVDYTNEVEFAKTLSMANLDVATSSALAQAELNAPLTELIRKVMAYELELDKDQIETIEATLIPSRSMLMQITSDLINTTRDLGQSMADVNITDDDDRLKKLFVKEFVRKNFTFDWSEIDKILKGLNERKIEDDLKTDITTEEFSDEDMDDDM